MKNLLTNKTKVLNILFYISLVVVIFMGIYIRAKYYFAQIPLWIDEIMLATNFIDRSFGDVFSPMEAFQKAPPIFFIVVMIIRNLFGINELTLRLVPFLLGVLSLIVFLYLLKNVIKNKLGILIGLCLFAFNIPLIYFSAEFKPYVCDVFFCILLMCININLDKLTVKQVFIYSICSFILVLVSFPSLFIIPAIIISKFWTKKEIDRNVIWILLSIGVAGFVLFLSDIQNYLFLKNYWNNVEHGFCFFPSLNFIFKYMKDSCIYYIYNFNPNYFIPVCILIFTGFSAMLKENREYAVLIFFIFILTLTASLFNVYPLKPKLTLFLLPIFILLISKAFDITCFVKNKNAILLNLLLLIYIFKTIGINLPYINLSENQLVYYNRASQSRNKSFEDRIVVKKICLDLINNANNAKILTSAEFLYGIRYYQAYIKSQKNLDINTYANIADKRLTQNSLNELVMHFLNDNLSSKKDLWFLGRDNENYFQCPNYETLQRIFNEKKINFNAYRYKDLYLINIKF